MRRSRRPIIEWPAWRYGPNGEAELFQAEEEVPEGWTNKPGLIYEAPPAKPEICKETVIKSLQDLGVAIDPTWGKAKLQELLKELVND